MRLTTEHLKKVIRLIVSFEVTHLKESRSLQPNGISDYKMQAYITNVQSFCAAHRLHNFSLTDEENKEHFGKCNHVNSHGHNYKIEATVKGPIDPTLGYVMNLRDLKKHLLEVIDPLDHKRIDVDIAYFSENNIVATAENIAVYIWEELEKLLPPQATLWNIRVHETDKNYVEYKGERS